MNKMNHHNKALDHAGGIILRCLILMLMAVTDPSWYDELGSNIVKFISNAPVIMTFDGAVPAIRDTTFKDGTKGKKLDWEVTVHIGEKSKKMVLPITSKRLKDALMAQDRKAPLKGRTLKITAFGEGVQRNWAVEEVQL